jgi:hypothetical protein
MRHHLRYIAIVSLLTWSSAQADSVNLPTHGGSGGSRFRLDCGDDKVLIGVSGRKGQWLDQIKGRCTKVSSNGKWVGNWDVTESAGGNGGTDFTVTCPRDTAIQGISGKHDWYVNSIALRCRPLGNSGSDSTIRVKGSQSGNKSFNLESCANSKPARGFRGKAGSYIDSIGLVCHAGTTPQEQVLSFPDQIVAVNLVNLDGTQTSIAPTPYVQIQWTDRSTMESEFRVEVWQPDFSDRRGRARQAWIFDRPPAAGVGSRQAVTIKDLPSGGYFFRVCAKFGTDDDLNRNGCFPALGIFSIAAAAICSPTITSAERIGAGTGRVRWSHGCENPAQFAVMLQCGASPLGTVATTFDGTAREETFIFGAGNGVLQVCALYPGQSATTFCSAQRTFACN